MSDDQTAHCDPQLIRALCGKYEKLCDLRQRQLSSVAPRAELVALAAGFPGALRELDCLPFAELERRLLALRAVLEGGAKVERWMVLQIAYHGCMRAVLRIRRLQLEQERQGVDATTEPQPLGYDPAPDEPALEHFSARDLAVIRKPPRGRLNPWVLARVAQDHSVTVACIENALWSASKIAFP